MLPSLDLVAPSGNIRGGEVLNHGRGAGSGVVVVEVPKPVAAFADNKGPGPAPGPGPARNPNAHACPVWRPEDKSPGRWDSMLHRPSGACFLSGRRPEHCITRSAGVGGVVLVTEGAGVGHSGSGGSQGQGQVDLGKLLSARRELAENIKLAMDDVKVS